MRKIIFLVIISITCNVNLFSQNGIEKLLAEIEKNNTTLKALREKADADKIGNKTGIYLQNPEVEFNYLWGNPAVIGNRTDINIKQTFDFPTAYRYKNKISDLKNEQVEYEYQKQLKSLLKLARLTCIDLIYNNALKSEFIKRLGHAESIANSYKSKYEKGEINILEYNKSKLNLLNISSELESIEIERKALLSDLTGLNGGISIDLADSVFQQSTLTEDFEKWYILAEQNNPILSWIKQKIAISKMQTKLNRAMSLPKLQTGYMSEKVTGQQFQGISLGMSIPLFENKNKLKYEKANIAVLESVATDNNIQFYNQLRALHEKVLMLQKNVNDYRSTLILIDNSELLKKALDKGEISIINYIIEQSIYYDSVVKLLELECETNKAIAELNQYL